MLPHNPNYLIHLTPQNESINSTPFYVSIVSRSRGVRGIIEISARLGLYTLCRRPLWALRLRLQEKALLSLESVGRFQVSAGHFWRYGRDHRQQALQDRYGSDHATVEVGAVRGSYEDMIRPLQKVVGVGTRDVYGFKRPRTWPASTGRR